VSLQAGASTVQSGTSVQLSWNSSNAASCSAAGGWGGGKATSGSQSVGPLSSTTSYQLTCSGAGGSTTRSVTVQVTTPEPSVNLQAAALVVDSGSPVQLSWTSSHASACTASGGWSGSKSVNGSQSVGPLVKRTTYTLNCSGDGGNAMAMISVAVNGTVTLQWQAPTENVDGSPLDDLASYKIYYGDSSRSYSESMTVAAGATSKSVTLESGSYYFAMTALDDDGNESAYSNEVEKTVD
jgi:hypothetical protein